MKQGKIPLEDNTCFHLESEPFGQKVYLLMSSNMFGHSNMRVLDVYHSKESADKNLLKVIKEEGNNPDDLDFWIDEREVKT